MNLQQAALFAALGVLLRALHYWVANVIPSWNSSGVMEQVSLAQVAIVDPLIWTLYFASLWRGLSARVPALLAAALGLAQVSFVTYQLWDSLSLQSLGALTFLFGAVLPVLCWTLYLVFAKRPALWYLLLSNLVQAALIVYQVTQSWPLLQEYWTEEPWQLLAAPLIWLTYWTTQTLFVRAAQLKA
jgi:hypothetical protein